MKNIMQLVVLVLMGSTLFTNTLYAESGFTTRGSVGNVRMNRRASGNYNDTFCFPVGDCHTHYSYKNAQKFLTYNPSFNGYHLGEDWNRGSGNDDYGDPVYSAGAGIVLRADHCGTSWGNCIITSHTMTNGKKVNFLYAHLKDMYVAKYDVVALHQKIGSIGDADGAYSAHLHFEGRYEDNNSATAGVGYSNQQSEVNKYFNPTSFISARLPKKFSVRPIEPCIGGVKKQGGVFKCDNTAQGGFVNIGDVISPLFTIDNVWVNHMFETKIYKNNVLWKTENSDIRFVHQEYGWSVSQAYHMFVGDGANVWRYDVFLHEIEGEKDQGSKMFLGSVTYTVSGGVTQKETSPINQSKNTTSNSYLLKDINPCLGIAGGANTDWVYTCSDKKMKYTEDDTFYILAGVMNLPKTHRFVVTGTYYYDEMWKYTSQWNVVTPNAPWKWAYTWPKVTKPQPGIWHYEVKLELENGVKLHLGKITMQIYNGNTSSSGISNTSSTKKTSTASQSNQSSNNNQSSSSSTSQKPSSTTPQKSSSSSESASSSSSTSTKNAGNNSQSNTQSNTSSTQNMSKEPYKFAWGKVCSSVSTPTADWSYSCIGEKYTYPSGTDKIYLLTKITDIWTSHTFTMKVYRDGIYLWEWTSDYNKVNETSGWKQAFFFPYLAKVGDGNWKVDVYINTKYGSSKLHTATFSVGNPSKGSSSAQNQQYGNSSSSNSGSTPSKSQSNADSGSSSPQPKPTYQQSPSSGTSTGTYSYQYVSACKAVTSAGKCSGEGYYYTAGSKVYFSVAVDSVSHPFQIKISGTSSAGKNWSWTSGSTAATDGPITKYVYGAFSSIPAGSWFFTVSIKLSPWSSFKVVGQTDLIVK